MPNKVPQKQAALQVRRFCLYPPAGTQANSSLHATLAMQNDARFIWQKMPRANLYYRVSAQLIQSWYFQEG